MGCSTTETLTTRTLYSFEYEGDLYEIMGVFNKTGEGSNLLQKRENSKIVSRARDYDQDGSIDEIQIGDISLEEANRIYNHGLNIALEQGKVKPDVNRRIYKHTLEGHDYSIQTMGLYQDEFFNLFTKTDSLTNKETYYTDLHADGTLDQIEGNALQLERIQKKYEEILKLGVKTGHITKKNNQYIVNLSFDYTSS